MARKDRVDRGLKAIKNKEGKIVAWGVRLYHQGKERNFGSFKTKTLARDFYEKAKQEQQVGRFFPERYHHGGIELAVETLKQYVGTLPASGKKPSTIRDEQMYARWWGKRLQGKRLNHVDAKLMVVQLEYH